MKNESRAYRLIVVIGLCAAWFLLVWSGYLLEQPWLGVPYSVALCTATWFALRALHRSRVPLDPEARYLCAGTLAILMFTAWGLLISELPNPGFGTDPPHLLRFGTLLWPGLAAALVVVMVFILPLAILLPKHFIFVPLLAAALVSLLQYEVVGDPTVTPLVLRLMIFELLCLLLLVPLMMWFLVKRLGHFRHRRA